MVSIKAPVPFNNRYAGIGMLTGIGMGIVIAIQQKRAYALNAVAMGVFGLVMGAATNQVVRMVKDKKSSKNG